MARLGTQLLLECYACDPAVLNDQQRLLQILVEDALGLSANDVASGNVHAFTPQGLSAAFGHEGLLVSLHTWPEHGHATIDIFSMVQPLDSDHIRRMLQAALRADAIDVVSHERRAPSR